MSAAKKLDYATEDVLIRNVVLSCKCQRCGRPSDTNYCKICEPPKVQQFDGFKKRVTTNGCNVYVNGALVNTQPTAFMALLMKKAMEKRFAWHNMTCDKHHLK